MKIFVISDIHGSLSAFNKAMDAFYREGAELLVICGDYLNHGPRNDIPDGYDTKGLAAALNSVKHLVVGVRGNCDSEVDQMMLEFPVLAPYTNIVVPGATGTAGNVAGNGGSFDADVTCGGAVRRIFVHHGHLMTAQEAARLNPLGTVIVSGHTHVPVLERFSLAAESAPCAAGSQNAKSPSSVEKCASDRAAKTQAAGAESAAEYIALNPGSISIPKGGSEPGYAVIAVAAHSTEIKLCTLDGSVIKTLGC